LFNCSGTLSYIFNNFEGTRAFSDVVSEAKEAGYTEPDPRDDLSGTDVARKVIILARESGLKLELSDIPVRSLVPEALRSCSTADEYMQKLPSFDQDWARESKDAEAAGEVLRYVGVVDLVNKEGQVELRRYKKDHPFAQLSGSDNIIAFTTSRYKEQPLIVRGPGAGAEVTAGGVFSDILRLASYLGAPS
jgi:aspartokinase/homoserine dehydrogenase 1